MTFTLTIDCGNTAFGKDICDACDEIVRILKVAADRIIIDGDTNSKLFDTNGNCVGEFYFNTLLKRCNS